MVSQYSKLLSSERFRPSSVPNRGIVYEAESDRGRLLFCAAFRRLQQKAQVFSMEPNAAVRSRLTHSFEVSQMGRYISHLISARLRAADMATENECSALVTFVETACLMHDIGNPPFGHFGEAAISEWFRKNGPDLIIDSCAQNTPAGTLGTTDARLVEALADFIVFDGNPQGLRVVTKLQRNSDEHGLNLTKTTIASYLKYIRCSKPLPNTLTSPFTKKCGYFQTERSIVEAVWGHYDYLKPQRFPLAYIMEAADDLAYCISDLEDSIEKGLLNSKSAFFDILKRWKNMNSPLADFDSIQIDAVLSCIESGKWSHGGPYTFTDFRTGLNRIIVEYCASQFIENHDAILAGTISSLISPSSGPGKVLQLLKDYCREKVYCHESVQQVELAGYTAIYGLLDQFRCLLRSDFDRFSCSLKYSNTKDSSLRPIVIEKKLLTLFPKNYIKVYADDLARLDRASVDFVFKEWALRAHLVTDFLSGMTDDFAMSTYQNLSGMHR